MVLSEAARKARNAYHREYYARNREHILSYQRQYYREKRKEKVREQQKKYYSKNKNAQAQRNMERWERIAREEEK